MYYEGKKVIAEVIYSMGMYILVSNEFADSRIPLFDFIREEDGCFYVDAVHVGNVFDDSESVGFCKK